jgi:hypothetical protein
MRALFLLVATILTQAAVARVSQPTERTLDLVTVPPPLRESPQGCGCVGVLTDNGERPMVKVTLVQVSPEAFGIGDGIVFELLVHNVGHTSVPIALTRDPGLAPSCHMTDTDVATTFALFAGSGTQLIGNSPRFSGSLAMPGTTMNLNAGERARVRVPAKTAGIDQTRALSDDPQALEVQAHFNTQRRCDAVFAFSENALAVHVSRPR